MDQPADARSLDAINRILREALGSGTPEQAALLCLESAEQLTGSGMGWVGELNARGRLHTLAMSRPGWDACTIDGDRVQQIHDMNLRGLWSAVLRQGRPLLCNEPAQHPEAVGLPLGHAPVDNFLGVPLKQGGRCFGMIALANKPGGYLPADLNLLLDLATALAEVLHSLWAHAELRIMQAHFLSSSDALAVTDLRGVITHANPSFVHMWGYQSDTEILGWPLSEVARLQTDAGQVPPTPIGLRPWRAEAQGTRRDGTIMRCFAAAGPVHDGGGQTQALAVSLRDASQQLKAEDRLLRATEELSRSNQDLEQFATTAAHELREPLRKILAFGEFLQTDCGEQLDKLGNEYLRRMLRAAERQQDMVDGLLRYARLAGAVASFARVDLTKLAWETASDLRYQLRETGGGIQVGSLPSIEGDESQLRLVFRNLLENGLKFRRQTEAPQITVQGAEEEGWAVIYIKDNGIGFHEQHLHRIFRVFGRLHGRHAYQGTGLGLPICQRIVEHHGGTITATSQPGRGSTFAISLPLKHRRAPNPADTLEHHPAWGEE